MAGIRRIKIRAPQEGEPPRLTEDLEEVFWSIIFGLMEAHSWSQVEASQYTGLPQSTISRAKRKAQGVTLSALTTVCGRLDISVLEFWKLYEGFAEQDQESDPVIAQLKARSRTLTADELSDILDLVQGLKRRGLWKSTLTVLQTVSEKLL